MTSTMNTEVLGHDGIQFDFSQPRTQQFNEYVNTQRQFPNNNRIQPYTPAFNAYKIYNNAFKTGAVMLGGAVLGQATNKWIRQGVMGDGFSYMNKHYPYTTSKIVNSVSKPYTHTHRKGEMTDSQFFSRKQFNSNYQPIYNGIESNLTQLHSYKPKQRKKRYNKRY